MVVLDATNLSERKRETLYRIAERNGARLVIAYMEAPQAVVKQRLERRQNETGNKSDADWAVYQKLRSSVEEIERPHYVVNTAEDITPAIDKIVRDVTIQSE